MSQLTSSRETPCSVSALVQAASRALDGLGAIWLEGELTQVSRPASGHVYLALRDKQATLPAVIWARDALRIKHPLAAGDQVRVRGRIGVFARDGKMQLYIDFVEPAGAGAAARALEELKAKLSAEGLFAAERKRPLPRLPKRIGVVTSATSAAAADILRTIERRFASHIIIADCMVQGAAAPGQIVQALRRIARAGVDVVIIGRGGGAVTDLVAFNDERVVRAVAACPVPVISAVGHEVDLTLCDFAADCRASTPTAAAELAVPVRAELQTELAAVVRRLARELRFSLARGRQELDVERRNLELALREQMDAAHTRLAALQEALAAAHPRAQVAARRAELVACTERLFAASPRLRVARARGELGGLAGRLEAATRVGVTRRRATWRELGGELHALSPLAVLDRGYAVLRQEGRVIRRPADAQANVPITASLAEGTLELVRRA